MTMSYVITLDLPRGDRWRSALEDRHVDYVGETLSLPPTGIVIALRPDVGEELATEIADAVRTGLDSGTVTVEFRERGDGP